MANKSCTSNRPLRILILGNIWPYRMGGAEVQSRRLAEAFARRGHRVTIAGYAVPDGSFRTAPPSGPALTTVHLATLRSNRLSRALSYFGSLGGFLIRHRHRFDVIYCRILGESALVAAGLKSLNLLPVPLTVSSACAGTYGDASFLEHLPGTDFLIKILNRGCDAVNILSPAIRRELQVLGFRKDKFTYIPNGIPIKESPRRPPPDPDGPRSLLFIGRLTPQKGICELLQAMSLLRLKGIAPLLHVVGDGPLMASLQRQVRELNIGDNVRFWGAVELQAVDRLHAISDVFVMPSCSEGQPNAMLEAMGAGLPVIVTRCGAEFMVTRDFGRITPVGDARALADCIAEMLRMPAAQLAGMGCKARYHVRSNFDIEIAADRYLDLFQRLVGTRCIAMRHKH